MYREKVLFSFKNRFYSEENYILFEKKKDAPKKKQK